MPEASSITADNNHDDTATDSPPAAPDRPKRTGPRILIVRPSALGDICKTVPALVTLRRAHPDAHIDWMVRDIFTDAIKHHPDLDRAIPFPRERFGTMYYNPRVAMQARSWAKQLREQKYDAVYDLQGLARSALITRLTRAPKRVGYARARELAFLGYNQRHKIDKTLHTTDRMLALLEADGLTPSYDLTLHLGERERQWLSQWLTRHNAQPYACIAPTAKWASKRWPIENFINITERLLQTQVAGPRVVVIATQDELDLVKPLLDKFGRTSKVLFPRATVGQMMALVARCHLFVGNDSAPLHVATAFHRPITAIFGPTNPTRVGPYGRPECVVEPPDAESQRKKSYRKTNDQTLIAKISSDDVWQHILTQLKIQDDPYQPQTPTDSTDPNDDLDRDTNPDDNNDP